MKTALFVSAVAVSLSSVPALFAAETSEILLESFEDPSHSWIQMNDPVMGGKSTGTFTIDGGVGIFDGEVVDVPFLQAPGFIKCASKGRAPYPDVSSCQALKIILKNSVDYEGYRVSFGNAHPPHGHTFAFGYKADLKVAMSDNFQEIEIPFKDFSDLWDDATGDQIKTCKEYPMFCPDQKTLENMKTISIWAEGVAGKAHLEIKSISATECTEHGDQS